MSFGRLRAWDVVVALLGITLLGLLRMDWYERPEGGASAYEAFSVFDILLVILAVLAVLVAVSTAAARRPAVPLPFVVVTCALAFLFTLVALVRLVFPPGDDVGLEPGAFLGTACLAALVYASYRAMRDERAPGIEPGPAPERMAAPAPGRGGEAPAGR